MKGQREGKEGVGKKEREGGRRGRERGMHILFRGDWRPCVEQQHGRDQSATAIAKPPLMSTVCTH